MDHRGRFPVGGRWRHPSPREAYGLPSAAIAEATRPPPLPCRTVRQVRLPHFEFVSARQESSQWCWAACIEMVFRAHGFEVPQSQFVEETFGTIVNMPGQPHQILQALNRRYVDTRGRRFQASGETFSVSLRTASMDLYDRQPLILGALGHATVLTGLSWIEDNHGLWHITEAIVRDPWPMSPSRRPLTSAEWNNVSFAARVRCVEV